jgi:hypothetical protein
MTRIALLFSVLSILCLADESPVEIVKRALSRDNRNSALAKNYTYQQRSVERQLDGSGKVKSVESSTRDVTYAYGRPLGRLLEKNGKPLTPKEQEAEEARLNKVMERRKRQAEEEGSKDRQRREKRRQEERKFLDELPQAFNFKMLGEETFSGRQVYLISAEPKPGFKPHDFNAKILANVHGKIWIDKAENQWVKVEVETIGTISFGLFIARLGPGAFLTFEQTRVNGELWLPSHSFIKADARLALLKRFRTEQEMHFSNYKKFQTDSKIVISDVQ